ncbi:MAG: META domain-containing protein [Devosia sp.]|jgi:putative lipoprotein|uniref:META domain-containing protein n=1 Tax=unclassified Devosia TaxID=196773 RepID=UPI0019E7C9E1|nr:MULTISPECIES: META domain-containing protein [unclassified Devosia]MBF0677574.1 META domain-containing protein [Devosia sp.]WEJ34366.1 META domain-containing protein [Devosia sp. SD17-2]
MFSRLIRIFAALLLLMSPALAAPLMVTGEVSYRERIALPAGASLHVGLVRLPEGTPIVGAEAYIAPSGQVPLSFHLNIRTNPDLRRNYGLRAEIRANGQVLFSTPAPVAVDLANPAPVSILVTRHKPQPVVTPPVMPEPKLIDTSWRVTSIGGKPVTGTRPITLAIAADLRATGNGGCNSYVSELTLLASKLVFGPAAATRMACGEDIMAQEAAYFAALAAVGGFELDDKGLRLLDPAGIPLVGLVPSEE